ncbi:MAG: histidine kinase [Chitinophagaceae bacterium]
MQTGYNPITPFNNPLIRFISDDKYRWIRHALFILMGLILAFKGDVGMSDPVQSAEVRKAVWLVDSVTFIFILGMLYLIMLVLIPRLLFRSRVFLFFLSIIIIIFLIYIVVYWLDLHYLRPVNPGNMQHIEFSVIHFIQIGAVCAVLLGAVIGLKVFKKWINDIRRMNELHEINLKTELEQLKSQVNPHFLFNTLNNLLVLTKTDQEKATQVLLGLSDLLRYQLYDSTREKIILTKDIAFIQNLLALEKIRKNDFTYTIHTNGNVDGQTLPPFLFIPFVENAIKHGASTVGHSYLTLNFNVADNQLHFSSENSKPAIKNATIGGIGLGNIKRRLELLYPGNHTLEIIDSADKYIVNLTIPL